MQKSIQSAIMMQIIPQMCCRKNNSPHLYLHCKCNSPTNSHNNQINRRQRMKKKKMSNGDSNQIGHGWQIVVAVGWCYRPFMWWMDGLCVYNHRYQLDVCFKRKKMTKKMTIDILFRILDGGFQTLMALHFYT